MSDEFAAGILIAAFLYGAWSVDWAKHGRKVYRLARPKKSRKKSRRV